MPYLSLYRKYRPRNFAAIVGQRHVTQTLANAVKRNRIAHAYLFCGPRGTGKTSTALVLAMALNCDQGPTAAPCGDCEACRRIVAGNALDVIEIDAASNRGIDEIRELRERVGLAPAGARMKVYIIDEVHMLTGEAFNAFLKTLEEPPPHVVFALATTEPHRVLPTILSRCQRFDFHRIGLSDLESAVKEIAGKEHLELGDRAITMLAQAADGSLRDALTLLDQAIAYAEEEITPAVITEILGGIDFDLLADLADLLIRGDITATLLFLERVASEGKDLRQLVAGLIAHYRNLLLLSLDRRGQDAVALPQQSAERAMQQAKSVSHSDILRALDLLAETDRELRFTSQPRLLVELAAVRICRATEPSPASVPAKEVSRSASRSARVKQKAAAPGAAPAEAEGDSPKPEPEAAAEPSGSIGLADIKRRWDELVTELRKSRKTAEAAFLRDAIPAELENGGLVLEFRHQFHHDQMTDRRREVVAEAIEHVFGLAVRVVCRMAPQGAEPDAEEESDAGKPDSALGDVLSIFPGSELED